LVSGRLGKLFALVFQGSSTKFDALCAFWILNLGTEPENGIHKERKTLMYDCLARGEIVSSMEMKLISRRESISATSVIIPVLCGAAFVAYRHKPSRADFVNSTVSTALRQFLAHSQSGTL